MSVKIKTQRVLLSSATRTSTTACAKQTDPVEQCCRVYLSVTAASGTGGLTPQFRGYDRVSGNAVALSQGGAAITATGTYCYEMMPNARTAFGSVKESVGCYLPYQWDFQVTHGDSSNYTYSLSCEVLGG
ncbi:MAG: hypothetical protein JO345_21965 [Streptosporangiaceae bacterium]|nr:hypothetical protein [Streptosporangiaceae bacterium]